MAKYQRGTGVKKQYRPITQYDEQFEDKTGKQNEMMDEYLKKAPKNPVNPYSPLDPGFLEEERGYRKDPRGYLARRYEESLMENIRGVGSEYLRSQMIPDRLKGETYDVIEDVLAPEYKTYHAMRAAIDEIQKSSEEAKYKVKNLELSRLMQSIEQEQREASPEESAKINELETELSELEENIAKESESEKKHREALGPYWAKKIQQDKDNTDVFYDSWEEFGDALGGSMSEIEAMVASMTLPAIGAGIGAGLAAGSLTAGKAALVSAWSGPYALLAMGAGAVIGFGVGFAGSIAAQRYSRSEESYAEMSEAMDSRVEGEKNKYRLMNGGKEMPPELVSEIEATAIDEAKSVYDANMDLFYVDVLEAGMVFIPWGHFKSLAGVEKMGRISKKALGLSVAGAGFVGGSVYEGVEEGYQSLLQMNYMRGDYDPKRAMSIIDSMGVMGETIDGMASNASRRLFDYRTIGGRTNTKQFRAAVNSGIALGGGMGAIRTSTGYTLSQSRKLYEQQRYGADAQEFLDEIQNRNLEAEQDKAGATWLFNKLAEAEGNGKNLRKILKAMNRSMPKLAEQLDLDASLKTITRGEQLYKFLMQGKFASLTSQETGEIFAALMSNAATRDRLKTELGEAQEALSELEETIPGPASEQENGKPEAVRLKAKIIAARNALNLKKKKAGKTVYEGRVNRQIAESLEELLNGNENEKGLLEQYEDLLAENNLKDEDIQTTEELVNANERVNKIGASIRNTAYNDFAASAAETGAALKSDPFIADYANYLQQPDPEDTERGKKEEEKEYVNSLDNDFEVGDTVKTPDGSIVEVTDINEDGKYSVKDKNGNGGIYEGDQLQKVERKETVKAEAKEGNNKTQNSQNGGRQKKKRGKKAKEEARKEREKEEERKKKEQEEGTPSPEPVTPEQKEEQQEEEQEETTPTEPTAPAEKEYSDMTVAELKELLRNRGLKVSGKKAELIKRLEAADAQFNAFEDIDEKASDNPDSNGNAPVNEQPEDNTQPNPKPFVQPSEDKKKAKGSFFSRIKDVYNKGITFLNSKKESFFTGKEVEFKIEFEKGYQPNIRKKVENKENLTEKELAQLPIVVTIPGTNITINMFNARPGEDYAATLALKYKIYNAYLKGKPAFGMIEKASIPRTWYSKLSRRNENLKLDIRSLFLDSEVTLAVQSSGALVGKNGEVLGTNYSDTSMDGRVFAIVKDPVEGVDVKVKLNQRDLNKEEVKTLQELLMQYINSRSKKSMFKDSNLTVGEYIDLLVFAISDIKNIDTLAVKPQSLVLQGGRVFYGENKTELNPASTASMIQFEQWALKNKKRNVHSSGFGKSIFNVIKRTITDPIKFLGTTYTPGVNDNYQNDFITNGGDKNSENHILTTNNKLDEQGRPTALQDDKNLGPRFYFSQEVDTKKKQKSDTKSQQPATEETPKQDPAEQPVEDLNKQTEEEAAQKTGGEPDTEIEIIDEEINPDDIDLNLKSEVDDVDKAFDPESKERRLNKEQALAYLKKVLGDSVPVEFQKSLINLTQKGSYAYGLFRRGMIILSEMAPKGTAAHEALHAIEELWLTPEQRRALDKETIREFGKAPQAEIDKIKQKYAEFNISDQVAEGIYYSEIRADQFADWTIAGEELGITGKVLRWFKSIKAMIKHMFSPKTGMTTDLLFHRISSGFYAKRQPLSAKVEMWRRGDGMLALAKERTPIPPKTFEQTVDYLLNQSITILGGYVNIKNLKDFKVNKGLIRAVIKKAIQTAEKENNLQRKQNLQLLLDDVEILANGMLDRLSQLNIREKKDTEAKNADLEASTKSAFESSAKDNATTNTRMIFSFLPKYNDAGDVIINEFTGLQVIENPTFAWNTVQAELADTVDYTNSEGEIVSKETQMLDKLAKLGERNPTFQKIYDIVTGDLDNNERNQFFAALSLTNNNFLTVNYSERYIDSPDGVGPKIKNLFYKFINPNQQSKQYRIRDKWFEEYKNSPLLTVKEDAEGNIVTTANKEYAEKALKRWQEVSREISIRTDAKGQEITNEDLNTIANSLSIFGISVSPETLKEYINSFPIEEGRITSKKGTDTLLRSVRFFFEGKNSYTVKKAAKGGFKIDFLDNNPIKGESTFILKLAELESLKSQDLGQTTILAPNNTTRWIYSVSNFFKKRTIQMNNSTFYADTLFETPFHRDSKILQYSRGGGKLTYRTFNSYKKTGGRDMGSNYTDLTAADEMALRVNLVLGKKYSPGTMADKSVWMLYEGKDFEYLNADDVAGIEYDKDSDTYIIPREITKWFAGYIVTDIARMYQTQLDLFGDKKQGITPLADEELIQFYHYKKVDKNGKPIRNREDANGLKSQIFPSLNNTEFLSEIGAYADGKIIHPNIKSLINLENSAFKQKVETVLQNRIQNEIDSAIKNSVIEQGQTGLQNSAIDAKLFNSMLGNNDARARRAISLYGLNSIISNIEIMKSYAGDPAFYKNMDDLSKRLPELIAPGQDLNIPQGKETYKMVMLNDVERKSAFYDSYRAQFKKLTNYSDEEIKRILKPYEEVSVTDAQGYITLERWKDIMEMLGRYDEKIHGPAYNRLLKGKGDQADMKLIAAMPLKGMHFELRQVGNLSVPTYVKYSQAVLFPQVVEGTQELSDLYDRMTQEDSKIDEAVFTTGIKVGVQNPKNVGEEMIPITLRNEYWKLQQDLRPHTSHQQLEGSQIKRNIIANVKLDEDYTIDGKPIKGQDLVKAAHDIDRELSNIGKQELLEEFGIEALEVDQGGFVYQIKDYTKLQSMLIKEFKKKEGTTQKLLESLELNGDKTGFKRPLSRNSAAKQIDEMIGSIITKRTVKLEMPGGPYVQMSNYGFARTARYSSLTEKEKSEINLLVNEKDLRPATINQSGGIVTAQIMLPSWFGDLIPGYDKMSRQEITKFIKNKKLLEGIAYRIPNQGMSSIDAFEVVGFLPQSMGDTVVAYDDITAKTGSDFDIDKMYVMLANYGVDKETGKPYYIKYKKEGYDNPYVQKKALQNRKLEIYRALVADEKTYIDLITPLDSIGLKYRAAKVRFFENQNFIYNLDNGKTLAKLEAFKDSENTKEFINGVADALASTADLEWFSPSYQINVKQTFIGGKFGVGQAARHLVDHAISQWASVSVGENSALYFSTFLGLGNTTENGKSDLSQSKGNAGNLITNTLSGRLNAYVDIAKDPYIFYLNNNSITANTVFMLDRLGVDPEWTDMFIAQPILKQFVEVSRYLEANNTTKIVDENKKSLNAEDVVLRDYLNKLKEAYLLEGLSEDNADIKVEEAAIGYDVIKESKQSGDLITEMFDIESLEEGIITKDQETSDDIIKQLKIYALFKAQKEYASKLNKLVSASKQDVDGAGGGSVNAIVSNNLLKDAYDDNAIGGVGTRFNGTMLEAYNQNSVQLLISVFGDQFNITSAAFQSAINKIEALSDNKDITRDPQKLRKVYNQLMAMYLAKKVEGMSSESMKDMIFGENNMVTRLQKFQTGKNSPIKNNPLITSLIAASKNTKEDIPYILFSNSLKKSGTDADTLTQAWDDLLSHPDESVRQFAEDLGLYSFMVSGNNKGLYSFYDLMPLHLEDKIFNVFNDDMNKIYDETNETYYDDVNTPELFTDKELETLFRNNSDNTDLVPIVPKNTIVKKTPNAIAGFSTGDQRLLIKEFMRDGSVAIVGAKQFVTLDGNLYKFAGWDNKDRTQANPVYARISALGYKDKGKTIFEPQPTKADASIVPDNNRIAKIDGVPTLFNYPISVARLKNKGILVESKSTSIQDIDSNTNTTLFALEDSFLNESIRQAELYKAAMGLKTRYSGSTLRPSDIRYLKDNGWSNAEVKAFEDYLKRNSRKFVGRRINTLAAQRFQEFLDSNKDIQAQMALLSEEADTSLNNFLMDILAELGVKVNETTLEDIQIRYGISAIGVADSIAKIIEIAKDQETRLTMPEEFSHMLIDLVGVNSDIMKPLMSNIASWGKFAKIRESYMNNPAYQNEDGTVNEYKIRKEAAGQLLGESIVYANEGKTPRGRFLQIAYDVYRAILEVFKDSKIVPVEAVANTIADDILEGKATEWMENYDQARAKNFERKEFEASLEAFPEAKEVLDIVLNKIGGILTGSLALRSQGAIYRPLDEPIHDLDFVIPETLFSAKTENDVWAWIQEEVMGEIPNFHMLTTPSGAPMIYRPNSAPNEFIVNAMVTEFPAIAEKFSKLKGNFTDRVDQLTQFEKDNIILLDFFINQKERPVTDLGHVRWDAIFEAKLGQKLKRGREKDYFDLRRFTLDPQYTINSAERKDSDFFFASLNNQNVMDSAYDALSRGAKKGGALNKFRGAYFALKYDFNKSNKYIHQVNRELFNGDPVLVWKKNETGQYKVRVNPDAYRAGQLDLFDPNTGPKKCN